MNLPPFPWHYDHQRQSMQSADDDDIFGVRCWDRDDRLSANFAAMAPELYQALDELLQALAADSPDDLQQATQQATGVMDKAFKIGSGDKP